MPNLFSGWREQIRVDKAKAKLAKNLKKTFFKSFCKVVNDDQHLYFSYYYEKMAYRVLFMLSKYKKVRQHKKHLKTVAKQFLDYKLS